MQIPRPRQGSQSETRGWAPDIGVQQVRPSRVIPTEVPDITKQNSHPHFKFLTHRIRKCHKIVAVLHQVLKQLSSKTEPEPEHCQVCPHSFSLLMFTCSWDTPPIYPGHRARPPPPCLPSAGAPPPSGHSCTQTRAWEKSVSRLTSCKILPPATCLHLNKTFKRPRGTPAQLP